MAAFANGNTPGQAGVFDATATEAFVSGPASAQSGLPLTFSGSGPSPIEVDAVRNVRLCCKRGIDIAIALAALIALSPLLLATALAIAATSPGGVLFWQVREGQHGHRFLICKFRSLSPCGRYLTPVGRFLRRTSIDELPQLYNVLKGEMSLVGPRPHVPDMMAAGGRYEDLVPYYRARQVMKPGLTGWAQVNGLRGGTHDAEQARARIDHDLAYVQNFTLLLDLRIMLLTLLREFPLGTGE